MPHECTQSRSVAVRFPTSIPRCCGRPYVRASRCYDPISIPPWAPRRPLTATPSVPLSKSTERSLTRAVRRAQPPSSASPRPHRGRNRGEGASEISHRRVFVPPHTIASSSHLAVAAHLPLPREPDFSFFSPPPPPSPPPSPPPPNLKILSHRPPAAAAIHSFRCPRRTAVAEGSEGRTVGFHSRRAGSLLRDSRQPAAVVLFPQQRVSVMLFLPRSLVLFVSLDLIPFASALFKQRERE